MNVKDLALQADYICDHEIERQKRVNDLRGDVPSALGQIRVPTRRREFSRHPEERLSVPQPPKRASDLQRFIAQ